ncbi:MAG TPA: LysR substrate-binding domain-containing protein [Sphingorhabdus sp.]|jgi:DNA-binding transcriptional LysR family regulator|nr:LysR substrate-binding domain-containing protein [Sphingorhabdus sp.]
MHLFHGIEAFVAVVETGSFTAAAVQLQTAKSSVSDLVRSLEDRVGARLLDRTTRSVRATEAGMIFYARSRRLLDEALTAREEIQAMADEPAGRLRVAAPDGFAPRYLVPALLEFRAAYPAVEIEMVESVTAVKLVEDDFDLAIRITKEPTANQVVRRIGTSRLVIVGSPAYFALAGIPDKPEQLSFQSCISFAPLRGNRWPIGGNEIRIRPKLVTHSTESVRSAALAGIGIAMIPEWMVADVMASGQLVQILDSYEMPSSGIFAVYPTNRLLTPKVRHFVDYLARHLKQRGLG